MMGKEKQDLGKLGERLAEEYLKSRGYQILERNYRQKWGEIDLITKKDNQLVFVEVKTLAFLKGLKPEDHLTKNKIKKLTKTVLGYLNYHQINLDWQLDLIAIEIDPSTKKFQLRHYQQIN